MTLLELLHRRIRARWMTLLAKGPYGLAPPTLHEVGCRCSFTRRYSSSWAMVLKSRGITD